MKKRAILLCVAMLLLTGCGESVIEITDEQTDIMATYAAGTLLKFSTAPKKGLTYVSKETYEEALLKEKAKREEQEALEEKEKAEEEAKETEKKSESGDAYKTTIDDAEPMETVAEKTITEVYDFGGADISYEGASTDSYVKEEDYFSLTASQGMEFLILNFSLENNTDADLNLNYINDGVTFSIVLNGNIKADAEQTFLGNDMTVLNTSLESGAHIGAVLIFEVPEGEAGNIESLVLKASTSDAVGKLSLIQE